MANKEQIRNTLLNEFRSEEPLMDIKLMRNSLERWLHRWNIPQDSGIVSWNDAINTYPATEEEKQLKAGLRVRIALKLYTRTNRYLISLLESLAPVDRKEYIITAHVNWTDSEKAIYKKVEQTYQGQFDDVLKARHVLWAQNFRISNVEDAITQCVVAILGHELIAEPVDTNKGIPIDHTLTKAPEFPEETTE